MQDIDFAQNQIYPSLIKFAKGCDCTLNSYVTHQEGYLQTWRRWALWNKNFM